LPSWATANAQSFVDRCNLFLEKRAEPDAGMLIRSEPNQSKRIVSGGLRFSEPFFTSLLSSTLLPWRSQDEDRVVSMEFAHQLPDCLGSVADIAVVVRRNRTVHPIAVMEFGEEGEKAARKPEQVNRYALNFLHDFCGGVEESVVSTAHSIFSVLVLFNSTGDITSVNVHGVCPISVTNGSNQLVPMLSDCLLLHERNFQTLSPKRKVDFFARIFELFRLSAEQKSVCDLEYWAHAPVARDEKPENRHARVELIGDTVFKLYHNQSSALEDSHQPDSPHVPTTAIKATRNLHQIRGAQIFLNSMDYTVLTYPFVEGKAVPAYLDDFLPIVAQLISLHEKGFCHGDIRGSNIVFATSPEKSTLIDFDYCVLENSHQYPSGWAPKLDDGIRHPDALAGKYIRRVHDVYSLVGFMNSFCECESVDTQQFWAGLCGEAKHRLANEPYDRVFLEDLEKRLKTFLSKSSIRQKFKTGARSEQGDKMVFVGTGSPPR
jgi:hypothetical protein